MAIDETELAALLDEAAISRVLSRYASMTDWLDFDAIAPFVTEDAVFDFGAMSRSGKAGYLAFAAQLEAGYDRRMHLFGLPRIILNGTEAQAEAPSVIHTRTHGDDKHADMVFYGRYTFRLRKDAGQWKLTRLTYYLGALYPSAADVMDESALNTGTGFGPGHPDRPVG